MSNQDVFYDLSVSNVKADIGPMSLLYAPENETFFVMNSSAGEMLTILEQARSRRGLEEAIGRLYPRLPERLRSQRVESFLALLQEHGIAAPSAACKETSTGEVTLPSRGTEFEEPIIRAYPKKWIIENHPEAVYDVAFSDTWSPASSGI